MPSLPNTFKNPNSLYDPILRMILENTSRNALPGVTGNLAIGGGTTGGTPTTNPAPGTSSHTHVFSESDFLLGYPTKIIYDDEDNVSEIHFANGNIKYGFARDVFDDVIKIVVTFMDTDVYNVGIIYQYYDLQMDLTDVPDKGNVIELRLL